MNNSVNNINCTSCKKMCCGSIPNLVPVLLPDEEETYALREKHETPFYDLWTLQKKDNKNCIYFDAILKRCTIYTIRPFECRIYPFLLDLREGELCLRLDQKNCPSATLAIIPHVQLEDIPEDWVKAYFSRAHQFNG